jgi:hypothetical protein
MPGFFCVRCCKDFFWSDKGDSRTQNVGAEQFNSVWNEYFALDAQYTKELIEARFSLKESLSREAWAAIFSSVSADTNTP